MPPLLRTELGWFALALITGLVFGLVLGAPVLLMLLFSCGYVFWLLFRMANIVNWLESGAAAAKAPPTTGLMDRVVGLVHLEKAYSRKQKNRYRSTLARFNSLAAELPDATVVFDQNRTIQWSNSAARNMLNVHEERDRGQRIDNLLRSPEMLEYLAQKESGVEVELPSPMTAGKTLSLIKVQAGKGMSVLIARDITQRVKVREMRKAFVADVSHELRTPLTAIQGFVETILENETLSSSTRDGLLHVQSQSNRMNHIVEHLLELSKLEGNPLGEKEGQPILVSAVIDSILSAVAPSANSSHTFELNVDDELLLLGSESEIYSACSNLISNAIKYTEKGTAITIGWYTNEQGDPVFSVEDNGAGIERQHLSRLSERFYRVDKGRSRETGGTGLGLAIVKHAAQRHGGQLIVDSQPGVGSQFQVAFPAHRAQRSAQVINL